MRAWLCAALALCLAACASPAFEQPGASRTAVLDKLGPPAVRIALPDGGERLLYTTQPAGRQVYHMDFDAAGRLVRTEQVLTFTRLAGLPAGTSRDEVHRTFGPPMLVEHVASFDGDIWTYRFRDDLGTRRQGHVHITPQGRVAKVMFTDDPDRADFFRF